VPEGRSDVHRQHAGAGPDHDHAGHRHDEESR
jgi:hypothetical protein